MYVIWSNEHKAWWAPSKLGYKWHIKDAGLYSREDAMAIVDGATFGQWDKAEPPNEVLVRIEDLPESAQALLGQI